MSVHRQQVRANLPSFECPPCPVTSGVLMADHRCPRLILADGPSTHLSSMETSGVQSRVRGISLVGGMLSAHLYPPGLRVRCNRPGLRQDYRPLESVSNRLTLRVSDVRPLASMAGGCLTLVDEAICNRWRCVGHCSARQLGRQSCPRVSRNLQIRPIKAALRPGRT